MTYPRKRVVLSFTLCPALVGVFMFGYFATIELVFRTTGMNILETLLGTLWFGVLSSLAGLIFYGVPALGLSVIYAYCQLHRRVLHVLIVCLAGGTAALAWGEVLPMEPHRAGNFCLGAVTSLLMALYALPKHDNAQ